MAVGAIMNTTIKLVIPVAAPLAVGGLSGCATVLNASLWWLNRPTVG